MKNNVLKMVIRYVPIILLVVLSAALIYCILYIEKLEQQIWERDKTIQELSFRSNLVEEYFDITHDSVDHTTSYSLKGSKANYVIMQQDSTELLFRIGDSLLSAQEFAKEFNSLWRHYDELVDKYNKLVKEFNVEFNENMHQIKELKSALNLIEKRYNIQYVVNRDSTFSVIKLSNTEKIDSALMLLPYYKDKIKKSSDNVWTIEYFENN